MTLIALYPPYTLPYTLFGRGNACSYSPYSLFGVEVCRWGFSLSLLFIGYKRYKDIREKDTAPLFALYPPYSLGEDR